MTQKITRMTQFVKEEIANAITHGIGAILSIPALIILIMHASKHGLYLLLLDLQFTA